MPPGHSSGPVLTRRLFIKAVGGTGAGLVLYAYLPGGGRVALAEGAGGSLDPADIPKFRTPLFIPPVMPRRSVVAGGRGEPVDYYEVSVRQLRQQVLPAGLPDTTVWGYGPVGRGAAASAVRHHAPSATFEARHGRPVRVKWVNGLVAPDGRYLPHLLPVDPTLHWANPPGGVGGRDSRPGFARTPGPYAGPVPMVTHLHGAVGVGDESDGYPQAWYLPNAVDVPDGHATEGSWYAYLGGRARASYGAAWGPGFAVYQYPNGERASTKWYHDHTLGMTRVNIYAGPAGLYLLRGGPEGDGAVRDSRSGRTAVLPGPSARAGDPEPSSRRCREIPLVVQDRTFNRDGSLFYPDSRSLFDGIVDADYLPRGRFSPIWNPEFFGNTLMVNGNTWPHLEVEQRRYRFRVLNACQSRFLILDLGAIRGVEAWAIGNDGGFLEAPVDLVRRAKGRLLLGPAERADLVVDFTRVPLGRHVLRNVGPDEPFGGGEPGAEPPDGFEVADPETTGQVLQLRVGPATSPERSTPPRFLRLPERRPLPREDRVRALSLVEVGGTGRDADGEDVEGPVEARLGVVRAGMAEGLMWMDAVTEDPGVGDTEVWEVHNTTMDAHPIHLHDVAFEVVDREELAMEGEEVVQPFRYDGPARQPEPWESGVKDTVVAYPGEVTRVRAQFPRAGRFVWHCHIVEHEDNEMMRPFQVGPQDAGQPD